MRAVNDRQRKFVIAYYHTGNREKAAEIAGYAGAPGTNLLAVSAFNVWHQPKVQAAIKEFGEQSVIAGLVPLAFAALEKALKLGDVKESTKAAQMVLDRTGFHAKSEQIVTAPSKTREEQILEIIRICKVNGLDPRKLIGGAVDFIDADYEVVDKSEGLRPIGKAKPALASSVVYIPTEDDGTEGLEDLL
jgi:phage terminase small subunit